MTAEETWFCGQAVAAWAMQVQMLKRLHRDGLLKSPAVKEIIDSTLLYLEERDQAIPEQLRAVNAAARLHLERVGVF